MLELGKNGNEGVKDEDRIAKRERTKEIRMARVRPKKEGERDSRFAPGLK